MSRPATLPKLHVAVLMGGWSSERPVSLMSGNGVAEALEARGHRVTRIDMGRDVALKLAEAAPDVVFNALHGCPGEDGTVQGMMDLMGVTYTHSGLATSVIAIDKELTKQSLVPHGIPMPVGRMVDSEELYQRDPLPRPYVLKPDGPKALMVTELKPKSGFYDFDAKYTDGLTEHVCPAEIPDEITQACKHIALRAHQLLGCRGTSRSDFRWDDNQGVEGLFLLEVNTQPGMTPLSLVPEQARHCGMSYGELVEAILADALATRATGGAG